MAYATQDDMVRKFGSDEVVALTDRERTGNIDAGVLAGALDSASSEIDTYLAARYRLPMAVVPRHLVNLCCDIARYNLVGAGARDTEEIQERYKAARKFLEYAADGKVTLGVDLAGATVQSGNTVQFNVGTRIFSDRDRGGY